MPASLISSSRNSFTTVLSNIELTPSHGFQQKSFTNSPYLTGTDLSVGPLFQRNHKISVCCLSAKHTYKEWNQMSEEGSFGITAAERFFGLILLAVGLLLMYYTLTSMDVLKAFTGFFGFLSLIFVLLGGVLITAKVE
jgi:hypothetical protein